MTHLKSLPPGGPQNVSKTSYRRQWRAENHPAHADDLFQNCPRGNLDVVALHLVRIGVLSLAANNTVWTEEYLINKHNTLPHTLYEQLLEHNLHAIRQKCQYI